MKIYLLILGMTLVTYLPRMLPALLMDKLIIPTWAEKWLRSVPYAVLAAMIFPGILTVNDESNLVGVIGGSIALFLSFMGMHIIFTIFGAIFSVMILNQYIF